jgi:hypothetical protein
MLEIRTLQDIPAEELKELREKIKRAHGKVIVLVHPFFFPSASVPIKYGAGGRLPQEYKKARLNLLKQSKTPLVILEEAAQIKKTRAQLEKLKAPKHLILPTLGEMPILATNILGSGASPSLFRILKACKAKRVFVGGMLAKRAADFTPASISLHELKWLRGKRTISKPISKGCVGSTYKGLVESGKFERVRLLTRACFPDKPDYPRIGSLLPAKPRRRRK